jgi:hypothetical protein
MIEDFIQQTKRHRNISSFIWEIGDPKQNQREARSHNIEFQK